jgi:hypothetical protein
VALRRVFDSDKMVADPADMAERADSPGRIFEQEPLESGIRTRLATTPCAIVRFDPGLIGLDLTATNISPFQACPQVRKSARVMPPPKTQVPVIKETKWVRSARTEDITNLPS